MLEEFSEHSHRLYLVSPRGLLTQTVAANRAPRAPRLHPSQVASTQLHPITDSRLVQVLRTAWKIDKYQDYRKVRKDISACKVEVARVTREIALRTLQVRSPSPPSLPFPPFPSYLQDLACGDELSWLLGQIHGSLGASWELPFAGYLMQGVTYGASTDQPPLAFISPCANK